MPLSPSHAPPAGRREVLAWCLYDFANSAFPTLITTVAYSVYFKQVVAGGGGRGDFLWGLSLSLAMMLALLVTPPLSAVADRRGARKRMLLAYTGVCVGATALLAANPGTQGILWPSVGLWVPHSAAMPAGVYDALFLQAVGYQISARLLLRLWFVGS